QRCPSPQVPGTQRSLQVPLSQYWPLPQFLLRHGSFWHLPAKQIWPPVQANDGSLQSMERGVSPAATQTFGVGHITPMQTSTQEPVFSSHFMPDWQLTFAQRCG